MQRKEFICRGCVAFGAAVLPAMLSYCVNTEGDDGIEFNGTITLTSAQKSSLDSNLYLNLSEGLIVIKDGSVYRAFSRRCPHEGGNVTARSYLSLECGRHIGQVFNQEGAGNGFRTSVKLRTYTVTDNAGTLTISG